MKIAIFAFASSLIFGLTTFSAAYAQDDVAVMKRLIAQVDKLRAEIKQLKDGIPSKTDVRLTGMPEGAVVAFLQSCASISEHGWSEYSPAHGRFLVGVNTDRRNGLSDRPFQVYGGEERTELKIANIPKHAHPLPPNITTRPNDQTDKDKNRGGNSAAVVTGRQSTLETGGRKDNGKTEPHNNMPPYIALYFCKKD